VDGRDIVRDVANHGAGFVQFIPVAISSVHKSTGYIRNVIVGHLEPLRSTIRLFRAAELDQRFLEVGQGTFNETVTFLEVLQKAVP
jgi:hypothetical protein